MSNWIVGQKAIFESNWASRIVTVSKVGKLHFEVEGVSRKFRISGGYAVGGSRYYRDKVVPYTQERGLAVRRINCEMELSRTTWSKYPLETLEQITAILTATPNPASEGEER